MNVVTAGPEFIRVARNAIGEKCFASPAISQGQLFLRGEHHLFCITAGNPAHEFKVRLPAPSRAGIWGSRARGKMTRKIPFGSAAPTQIVPC